MPSPFPLHLLLLLLWVRMLTVMKMQRTTDFPSCSHQSTIIVSEMESGEIPRRPSLEGFHPHRQVLYILAYLTRLFTGGEFRRPPPHLSLAGRRAHVPDVNWWLSAWHWGATKSRYNLTAVDRDQDMAGGRGWPGSVGRWVGRCLVTAVESKKMREGAWRRRWWRFVWRTSLADTCILTALTLDNEIETDDLIS